MKRVLLAGIVLGLVSSAQAGLIVDFSPDTTGAPVGDNIIANRFAFQVMGDRFVLNSDVTLTGGAIFSNRAAGAVNTPARFLIFEDFGGTPASAPTIDIPTILDAVDDVDTTTQARLTRKHAAIAPTFLSAGTYWFAMPGDLGNDILQGATSIGGGYDDNQLRFGDTNLQNSLLGGDLFFQLEAEMQTVPEPSTFVLLGIGGIALVGYGCRRRRQMAA